MTAIDIANRAPFACNQNAMEHAPPEDQLNQHERLAIQYMNNIGALTREARCDPDQIAQSLDRIDFALGQIFSVLHRD